jgi:hypothetical protein
MEVVAVLLHFERHAGLSGTSLLVKALDTNQGTQAQQETASRRGLGNGRRQRIKCHIVIGCARES